MRRAYFLMATLLLGGFSYKLIAYFTATGEAWAAQVYMLLITLVAWQSVEAAYGKGASGFLDRLKIAMRPVVVFAVSVSLFTWFYYAQVDTDFMQIMIVERLDAAQKAGVSAEELQKMRGNLELFFSARLHSLLVGFILLGYGIISTVSLNFALSRLRR
jgi:hypothetical protein